MSRLHPSAWPLTFKVPMLAAGLMVSIGVLTSHMVLQRLIHDQQTNLQTLTAAYLDGLSTAVLPHVVRADTWETFDALDRARSLYGGVRARYALVALPNDSVLAASDPRRFPAGSGLPPDLQHLVGTESDLVTNEVDGSALVRRTLRQEDIDLGTIIAEIDIRDLLQVRHEVLLTLVLANGALTLLFATIGYFAVRRMIRPISLLTRYVERVRDGSVEPIPANHLKDQGTEFGRLFHSFNAMAAAVGERQSLTARLAEEEKAALLGKLATGMAHEVNNPLGGMLNLVDTLKKHGHDPSVRQRCLDLLDRGITGIASVVRASLATYKGMVRSEQLRSGDLDDLRVLLQHEIALKHLRLVWENKLPSVTNVDGGAVRQIALNLLLNACAATPDGGAVELRADVDGNAVEIMVADTGPGLPEDVAHSYADPDSSTQPPSGTVGLGVWTICLMVARHRGRIKSECSPGGGTRIRVSLPITEERALDAVA